MPLPQNGPPAAGSVITPVYDPYWRYDPDPFRLAIMSRVEEALDQGLTELDLTDLLQDRQIPADETAAFQRLIGSLIFTVKEGNPAYFYYDNTVVSNTRYTETDEVRTFVEYRISFSYREAYASQTAREAEWANLTREANRVAGIIMTRTSNDWQRLRLVHDYLAVKNVYSPDSNPLTNNVVNGLLGTETMCVGYAQAFQMIASRMGYETYNIYGFAFDQAHLWNIVNLNGRWYHVDVTFDDPAGNTFEIPLVKTQFFLRSAASMAETHETYSYAVPAADSDYLAEHHDVIRNYEDSETLTESLAEYIAALNFSSGRAHVFEYYTQTLNLSAQSLDMMIREAFERALTTVSVSYSYIVREDTGAIFFFPPQP